MNLKIPKSIIFVDFILIFYKTKIIIFIIIQLKKVLNKVNES